MKSRLYNFYQIGLIIWALTFIFYSEPIESKAPVDFSPLYRDAIKAADPFEDIKDGIYDYVTF